MALLTDDQALDQAFARLREASRADPYPGPEIRRAMLRGIETALAKRKDAIVAAVDKDFGGRLRHETLFAEIYVTIEAFRHARRHVKGWMKRRRRSVPLTLAPGRAWVQPQPVGLVGIIAPWNYPLLLALTPVAGALAAGNRVLVKPSELTPSVTALIAEILDEAVPPGWAAVALGGPEMGSRFARLPFDHLLFTGSTRVGRSVMEAAAPNLTPVTLELGGKSPALILPGADMAGAAADIAYGKFTNAGQTCVAPDYVLVPRGDLQPFLAALEKKVAGYFPQMSAVFGEKGKSRAASLLDEACAAGAEIRGLGPGAAAVIDPPATLALMQEEIFAPILPVIPYDGLDQALEQVRAQARPLAFYLFGKDRGVIERSLLSTLSGGAVINDTLIHVGIEDLPFGGIGPSGMGRYHGREGFDTFSHLRAVFERTGPRIDRLVRPPLKGLHERLARLLIGG
ncbi:MAG TPA: aldehyde dehydrogenase family protein [Magnetospirillaceae bacterium]|nr:aldehyde dehydrogenase family protein [Magnetospirillaceae bacterium]